MNAYEVAIVRYRRLADETTQRAVALTHFGPAILTMALVPFLAWWLSRFGMWGLVALVPATIVTCMVLTFLVGAAVKYWHDRRLDELAVRYVAATEHLDQAD